MAALFDGQNDGVFRSEAVVRDPHHRTFAIVSLSVSLASLIATVISFYWFVKMRRSFRHEYVSTPLRVLSLLLKAHAASSCYLSKATS